MKNFIIWVLVLVLLVGVAYYLVQKQKLKTVQNIQTFEDCKNAGYPILESFPERCLTPDGRTLTNENPSGTNTVSSEMSAEGTLMVDASKSKIIWEGKKKLISAWVDRGTIALKSGSVVVKENKLESGEFVFDMNSIVATKTGSNGGFDRLTTHLKSADFFDVAKYPEAKFVAKEVVVNTEKDIVVKGDLTIKDKTNPIEIPFKVSEIEGYFVGTGEVVVDRTKFDVRYGSSNFFDNLGNNVIENDFKLVFEVYVKK